MQPTIQQVKAWTNGNLRHPNYDDSTEYAHSMKVHALGMYSEKLIEGRRPSESKEIQNYRADIFVSPTMGTWGKLYNSLTKIRKASDYTITFDNSKVPSLVAKNETPQVYFTENFPTYQSLDNWFWSICFHKMLVDSNAMVCVMPMTWDIQPSEYMKPYPVIFESENVIDYNKGEWYFFKSEEVSYFGTGRNRQEGKVFYYVDKEGFYRYTQTDNKGSYAVEEFIHNLGYAPVIGLHGVVEKDNNLYSLCRTRIHSVIDWMNEAVREYSDLQAAVVQSVFPTMWAYAGQACKTCDGSGKVLKQGGAPVACPKCNGRGSFAVNPYETILIDKPKVGESPMPSPFAGFIEKDIEVVSIQDKRIDKHLYNALKTVNMEHLDSVPLAQSGVSKEWDRAEANNFVYMIAEDCVRVMDSIAAHTIDLRYGFVAPDPMARKEMRPKISVPQKVDIMTDAVIAADIKMMKDVKFNQLTIAAAEVEYINRRFLTDQKMKDMVVTMFEVDSLAGKSEDDILLAVSNGWVKKEAAIIHANIKEFVERAMDENPEFLTFTTKEKKEIVMKYAMEQMQATTAVSRILPPLQQPLQDTSDSSEPNE